MALSATATTPTTFHATHYSLKQPWLPVRLVVQHVSCLVGRSTEPATPAYPPVTGSSSATELVATHSVVHLPTSEVPVCHLSSAFHLHILPRALGSVLHHMLPLIPPYAVFMFHMFFLLLVCSSTHQLPYYPGI